MRRPNIDRMRKVNQRDVLPPYAWGIPNFGPMTTEEWQAEIGRAMSHAVWTQPLARIRAEQTAEHDTNGAEDE